MAFALQEIVLWASLVAVHQDNAPRANRVLRHMLWTLAFGLVVACMSPPPSTTVRVLLYALLAFLVVFAVVNRRTVDVTHVLIALVFVGAGVHSTRMADDAALLTFPLACVGVTAWLARRQQGAVAWERPGLEVG